MTNPAASLAREAHSLKATRQAKTKALHLATVLKTVSEASGSKRVFWSSHLERLVSA